jgi:hypothetical protein
LTSPRTFVAGILDIASASEPSIGCQKLPPILSCFQAESESVGRSGEAGARLHLTDLVYTLIDVNLIYECPFSHPLTRKKYE